MFSNPIVVNDNLEDIGHTYHTSGLNAAGDLFVVWLDDRGGNHVRDGTGRPKARGMYYAVFRTDAPLGTPVNHLIAGDRVCDCCRPAIAFGGSHAWLMARLATDDGIRDHASYRLGREGVIGSARPVPPTAGASTAVHTMAQRSASTVTADIIRSRRAALVMIAATACG